MNSGKPKHGCYYRVKVGHFICQAKFPVCICTAVQQYRYSTAHIKHLIVIAGANEKSCLRTTKAPEAAAASYLQQHEIMSIAPRMPLS